MVRVGDKRLLEMRSAFRTAAKCCGTCRVPDETDVDRLSVMYCVLSHLARLAVQNPDNKVAEDMFVKITKAYEALTDAAVRQFPPLES